MCGSKQVYSTSKFKRKELRDKALKMAQKIRHRGPDWSGIYVAEVPSWHTNVFPLSTRRVADNRYTLPIVNKCSP